LDVICTPITQRRKTVIPSRIELPGKLALEVLSLEAVRALGQWDKLAGLPFWLGTSWLEVLAKAGAPDTRYLQFSRAGELVGVCLLQQLPVKGMKLGESVSAQLASTFFGDRLEQFGQVLYCANGGLHFLPGESAAEAIAEAREVLSSRQSSCCYLIKDLPAEASLSGWNELKTLPEMVMELPAGWTDFEDYLTALPSKYRTRARRARKKFAGLRREELGVEQVVHYSAQIDRHYTSLIDRASYVPYQVPAGYFARLKAEAPEQVQVSGYFAKDELVGFSTLLLGEDEAIAHYAAVESDYNASHQLYLNMLFDLLESALATGVSQLHFGRTATTIKSSVGAEPRKSYSYASHDGCIRHQMLSAINSRILANSDPELIQRPFAAG
jgi:hypothetical protein